MNNTVAVVFWLHHTIPIQPLVSFHKAY